MLLILVHYFDIYYLPHWIVEYQKVRLNLKPVHTLSLIKTIAYSSRRSLPYMDSDVKVYM